MKRLAFLMALAGVLMFAGTASAQSIVTSAHDFSGSGWASGEICIPCHTPHNALPADPLWNHETSGEAFTMYASTTIDGASEMAGSVSLRCMSCHDGATAMDAFGGDPGVPTVMGAVVGNLGTNLDNDHPIGIAYRDDLDSELRANTGDTVDNGAGIVLPLFATTTLVETVECASCHDVHNTANANMLLAANTGSALCLTCHTK